VAEAAAERAKQHASVMEEQKRVHKAKDDAKLEDELLEMCIKESLEEKERLSASQSSSELLEPDHDSSNEEKVGECVELTRDDSVSLDQLRAAPVKLMARFVRDVTMPDGSEIAPCSTFVKSWRVRNDGAKDWPDGCHLVCAGGDNLLPKNGDDFVLRHPVPATAAGDEVELSLELCAPSATGRHVGYFRLENPVGGYFGQRLWADIRVAESEMSVSMTLPWELIDTNSDMQDTSIGELELKDSLDQVEDKSTVNSETSTEKVDLAVSQGNVSVTSAVAMVDKEREQLLEETPLLQFDKDVATWNKELQVLSSMGFTDMEQLLPVLKAHIKVPASQQPMGEVDAPGSEAGLQAVVLALLNGHE
jgi:hypothetical protein